MTHLCSYSLGLGVGANQNIYNLSVQLLSCEVKELPCRGRVTYKLNPT